MSAMLEKLRCLTNLPPSNTQVGESALVLSTFGKNIGEKKEAINQTALGLERPNKISYPWITRLLNI
jgi:hypothetical protein